jgi:hypothetical protein
MRSTHTRRTVERYVETGTNFAFALPERPVGDEVYVELHFRRSGNQVKSYVQRLPKHAFEFRRDRGQSRVVVDPEKWLADFLADNHVPRGSNIVLAVSYPRPRKASNV